MNKETNTYEHFVPRQINIVNARIINLAAIMSVDNSGQYTINKKNGKLLHSILDRSTKIGRIKPIYADKDGNILDIQYYRAEQFKDKDGEIFSSEQIYNSYNKHINYSKSNYIVVSKN